MWRSRPRLANLLLEKADSDAQMLAAAQQSCSNFSFFNKTFSVITVSFILKLTHFPFFAGHQFWYSLEHPELLTAELRATFQETTYDEETEAFVKQSLAISNNICLQVWYSMAAALLSLAMSRTSINGLLGRGGMFIFSPAHLRAFLGLPDIWSPIQQRLLDIGAGDGGVTTVMHQFFGKVSAVEASKVMEWRLAQRGFHVLPLDRWASSGPYDLISALNLLDRHHDPGQLLADLHSLASKSGCCLLLSVVLPVSQYVEFGPKGGGTAAKKTLISSSSTTCDDRRFERQANALVEQVFKPAGFQLLRWTRLPYLCEGDLTQAFYKLDDAVFLLKPIPKTGDDIFTHKSVPNGTVEGTIVCIQDEL